MNHDKHKLRRLFDIQCRFLLQESVNAGELNPRSITDSALLIGFLKITESGSAAFVAGRSFRDVLRGTPYGSPAVLSKEPSRATPPNENARWRSYRLGRLSGIAGIL